MAVTAGLYIRVAADQVDEVRKLLDREEIRYWADSFAVSLNGKPAVTVINLGLNNDADRIQAILDASELTEWRRAVPLADAIRDLSDRIQSDLAAGRDYFEHTKIVWRVVRELADQGQAVELPITRDRYNLENGGDGRASGELRGQLSGRIGLPALRRPLRGLHLRAPPPLALGLSRRHPQQGQEASGTGDGHRRPGSEADP